MNRLLGAGGLALLLLCPCAHAQVIEYESNGLKYQTLTKSGVTIMFAVLPSHLHEYTTIQAAVSNGSEGPYVIRPEDFTYVRDGNVAVRAAAALTVVDMLQRKGSGSDVIKLVASYEAGVFGTFAARSFRCTLLGALAFAGHVLPDATPRGKRRFRSHGGTVSAVASRNLLSEAFSPGSDASCRKRRAGRGADASVTLVFASAPMPQGRHQLLADRLPHVTGLAS